MAKIPYGWLLCDGREVSRTEYSALFNVIGTKFGNGDKINTFNVPDLRDRFLQGANGNLGTVKEAGLPNITGNFSASSPRYGSSAGGAFAITSQPEGTITGVGGQWYEPKFNFNASSSSAVYGKSDTVQPPAVCVNYIIKYYC